MATQEELEQHDKEKLDKQPPPFPLTERDKWLLSISDDEFTPHSWDNLKQIIGEQEMAGVSSISPFLCFACMPDLKLRLSM